MSLHAMTTGHGPDLVLVHGWGLHSAVWAQLLPVLQARWRVTWVDLPGHGLSSPTVDLRDLDAVCAQFRAVVPPMSTWIGWSLGGLIAIAYADRYAKSLRRLILVASLPRFTGAPDWPNAMPVETIDQFEAELKRDRHALLRRFLALQVQGSEHRQRTLRQLHAVLSTATPDSDALHAGLALLRVADLRSSFAALACPTRLVLGECDALVPAEAGSSVARLAPNARYEVMTGAGHVPFLSHPRRFVQVMERCLDE
jgi:pimeloyl-[acyl-carrier protein] methyl ester esterase